MTKSFSSLIFLVVMVTIIISSISTVQADIEPPKKQWNKGVPAEKIVCKEGLDLVIRINGMPACVKPATAERMESSGIVKKIIKMNLQTTSTSVPIQDILPNNIPVVQDVHNEIESIPASSGSIVNFYITDQDLNLAHSGVEEVSTEGLLQFSINGIPIDGPETMIETGPNTGKFYVKLQLPDSINGKPIDQDDVVLIKYLDESDASGDQRTLEKSVSLKKTFAKVQTSGGGSRIGHEFILRLYEPDANRDSRDEDRIPLSVLEYRGEGGIRTTLANPKFDANASSLIETGPNTGIFEIKIKIPRQIDGETIHIGDWYEIRYIDRSTPSNTNEKIILKGRIG